MSGLLMCFGCEEKMLLDQKPETIVSYHALASKVLVSHRKTLVMSVLNSE